MSCIRPAIIIEEDLGPLGWRTLHGLARDRGRTPRQEVLQLVRYALVRAVAGDDVELSQGELRSLLDDVPSATAAA